MSRICFRFDEAKATAAAAVLLKKLPGRRMSYIQLIKLLYIAERESLRRRGAPVVGDWYVSMKHGPVLSRLYNLIKADEGDLDRRDLWARHVKTAGFDVELIEDPGTDALSPFEVKLLEEVFDKHRHLDRWRLCNLTHTFPEWRDPGESSSEIEPGDILRAVGRTPEEIEVIAAQVDEADALHDLFHG